MRILKTVLRVAANSVAISAFVSAGVDAQSIKNEAPRGFKQVDHDIRIGTLNGRLRYDVEKFRVRPGSRVKLTLANNDSMQHNLLICKPGKGVLARVAAGALALGGEASAKHFVPELPEVLFHTNALMPGQRHTIWFRAPSTAASYPYICTLPGHTFTMRGVMIVGDVADSLIHDLRYDLFRGKFRKLADIAAAKPDRSGVLREGLLDLNALGERSNYGVWFRGQLRVERAGKYTFFLRSDDGSRVRVDGTEVVAHDGIHGLGKERKGSVELTAGRHVLRVEFFQGGGGQALRVDVEGPGLRRHKLTVSASSTKPRGIPIMVMHDPVVMRVHVEHAAARSIAVGIPGGMNFVFDADACGVQFGWAGAFLDVGPDRLGRGGKPCRILGQKFAVGDVGFPLRRAGTKVGPVRYRGYRTGGATRFLLDWAGQHVTWTVTAAPSGVGLRYTFELPGVQQDVQFAIRREGLEVEASAGQWSGGVLTVPAKSAARFEVTLRSVGGAK